MKSYEAASLFILRICTHISWNPSRSRQEMLIQPIEGMDIQARQRLEGRFAVQWMAKRLGRH